MNFLLSLITFLLIVLGGAFWITCSPTNRNLIKQKVGFDSMDDINKEKVESFIRNTYIKSAFATVLGVGIIVARLFS